MGSRWILAVLGLEGKNGAIHTKVAGTQVFDPTGWGPRRDWAGSNGDSSGDISWAEHLAGEHCSRAPGTSGHQPVSSWGPRVALAPCGRGGVGSGSQPRPAACVSPARMHRGLSGWREPWSQALKEVSPPFPELWGVHG